MVRREHEASGLPGTEQEPLSSIDDIPESVTTKYEDYFINQPKWVNNEFVNHPETKIELPSDDGLGLGFSAGGYNSSLNFARSLPRQSKDTRDYRELFVEEIFQIPPPASVIAEEEVREHTGKQILKRRRSLDDDVQRRESKREKRKLYERRRSLDSSTVMPNPMSSSLVQRRTPVNRLPLPIPGQTQSRAPKRSNLWTYEEEVFLVAAVMECFLRRGSLTSNRGRDGCWNEIKKFFDTFSKNYNKMNNKKAGTERASSALYRHFKTLKERISKDPTKDLREYYRRFQFEYNRNDCLLNSQ